MLQTRVIPVLLLRGSGLVKTVRFREPNYLGDPRNAVKIFNEKEVDELVLLDIEATRSGKEPNFELIEEIVSEAFMPIGYGGGIQTVEQAVKILKLGVEKVIIGSQAPSLTLVEQIASRVGNQSVVACIDAKRGLLGGYDSYVVSGTRPCKVDPPTMAQRLEAAGAGEIIIQSIDRDGTMIGYDIHLTKQVTAAVRVPVIACGGAGTVEHLKQGFYEAGASALAAGSMFVYQGRHRAVLISYPERSVLEAAFAS